MDKNFFSQADVDMTLSLQAAAGMGDVIESSLLNDPEKQVSSFGVAYFVADRYFPDDEIATDDVEAMIQLVLEDLHSRNFSSFTDSKTRVHIFDLQEDVDFLETYVNATAVTVIMEYLRNNSDYQEAFKIAEHFARDQHQANVERTEELDMEGIHQVVAEKVGEPIASIIIKLEIQKIKDEENNRHLAEFEGSEEDPTEELEKLAKKDLNTSLAIDIIRRLKLELSDNPTDQETNSGIFIKLAAEYTTKVVNRDVAGNIAFLVIKESELKVKEEK